jgi:hypothetical protein
VNLVRAELDRLFTRRFTQVMLLVVAVMLVLVAAGVSAAVHKPSAQKVAAARAEAAADRAHDQQVSDECQQYKKDPTAVNDPSVTFWPGIDCAQFTANPRNLDDYLNVGFDLRGTGQTMFLLLGGVLALFGFAVGASYIGADWTSGALTGLLLWRPRRVPLLLGKLGSLLLGVAATGVVFSAAWFGAVWLIALTRGSTEGVTVGVVQSLLLTDARAVGLALAAAVLGFGIASLGRHTSAALGAAIGYLIVVEAGVRLVFTVASAGRPERWYLSSYVAAWLDKGQTYQDYGACHPNLTRGSICEPLSWGISGQQGLAVIGTLAVCLVLVASYAFRIRDVK